MRKNKVLTPLLSPLYYFIYSCNLHHILLCIASSRYTCVCITILYFTKESARYTKVKLSSCISNKTREKIYNSPMYIERFSNHLLHVRSKMVNPCNIYVLFTYSLLFFNSRGLIFIIIIYNTECYSHFYDINL